MERFGVWEMISSGGARAVHHIESPAMLNLSKMCNVREIDGLIAIVSVIRPGAANAQKKEKFTRRYQQMEPVTYPHLSLEQCLKSTYVWSFTRNTSCKFVSLCRIAAWPCRCVASVIGEDEPAYDRPNQE